MEERVTLAQNDIITNITAMGLAAGDIVSIMSPDSTDDDSRIVLNFFFLENFSKSEDPPTLCKGPF